MSPSSLSGARFRLEKPQALREQSNATDADALVIVDADTVLVNENYVLRLIEELFKNAGVASACGEVMPLTDHRKYLMLARSHLLQSVMEKAPASRPRNRQS